MHVHDETQVPKLKLLRLSVAFIVGAGILLYIIWWGM